MRWKVKIRRFHRWLSVIIGIQILFWTLSGAYFSLVHIKTVRGEDRMTLHLNTLNLPMEVISPSQLVVDSHKATEIRLKRNRTGRLVYEVYYESTFPDLMIDAATGNLLPEINPEEARALAKLDYKGNSPVKKIVKCMEAPKDYKRPLPVYQVMMDDRRHTRLYISPTTGEVLKRRNRFWRIFDFLWMLHIMDFDEREDFNNPLLRVTALSSIFVVVSGYLLWATSRRWRRAKSR